MVRSAEVVSDEPLLQLVKGFDPAPELPVEVGPDELADRMELRQICISALSATISLRPELALKKAAQELNRAEMNRAAGFPVDLAELRRLRDNVEALQRSVG